MRWRGISEGDSVYQLTFELVSYAFNYNLIGSYRFIGGTVAQTGWAIICPYSDKDSERWR